MAADKNRNISKAGHETSTAWFLVAWKAIMTIGDIFVRYKFIANENISSWYQDSPKRGYLTHNQRLHRQRVLDPIYLHDGVADIGGDGDSLPHHEVDIEGLEVLFVVLGADAFVLSNDAHFERRFFSEEFRKRRLMCLSWCLGIECPDEMPLTKIVLSVRESTFPFFCPQQCDRQLCKQFRRNST